MKILLVTPIPPQRQPTNAVPLVTYGLARELATRHTVTLVTVADKDPAAAAGLAELRNAGVAVQAVHRVEPQGWARWQRRWRFANSWLSGRYPWRTIWFWEMGVQQRIDRLLAHEQFDLVVVDDNAVGVYHYRTNTPTIYIEHEVRRPRPLDWQGRQYNSRLWWALGEMDWRRWQPYQRRIWQKFPRIQVFTQRDADAIQALVPEVTTNVRVNPFGLLLPPTAKPEKEEAKTLVFAGGFSHFPNVDAALWLGQEIMPLLRNCSPGVQLLLVGSYPPAEVRALACADIIVTGRVAEIEPFLERAAIILAPLRVGGGMRMKVLQGMALGKAVVTTPRGAEGLLATEEPPLVVAEDAQTLASAIATLLAEPEKRQALGSQARAFVAEHHSAAAYTQRLEAIYAELVEQ